MLFIIYFIVNVNWNTRCRRGRMLVGFTTNFPISAYITTIVVSSNLAHGGVYLIQHYHLCDKVCQ